MRDWSRLLSWLALGGLLTACAVDAEPDVVGEVAKSLTADDSSRGSIESERARMRAWAQERNAPEQDVVARVQAQTNEFDCVPWGKQPAVRGKGLRRGDITPPPSLDEAKSQLPASAHDVAAELGHGPAQDEYSRAATRCPEGSVPMRRISDADLAEFSSLEELKAHFAPKPHVIQCDLSNPERYYENYGAEFTNAQKGAHARVLVDNSVQVTSGHSIGQIWLSVNHHPCSGTHEWNNETIESGWVKRSTGGVELFVFSTPDGYDSYCWNMGNGSECQGDMDGLISMNQGGIVPGSTLTNGYMDMAWHLYPPGNVFGVTPGWWFFANGWVGYYSLSNYDQGIQNGVELVMVGGEITIDVGNEMGNGQWGVDNTASYVDKWWYLDWNHYYRNYNNPDYWGGGRYDSVVNGQYQVDGRYVPSWYETGTYSTVITNNNTFFWFGGPGPGWN